MSYQLHLGDAVTVLRTLDAGSVQTCVTSPPYFGLRSYLDSDDPAKHLEIGTEQTPEQFVARLVDVFREVRRVLRDDGTLWLNLGDSYCGGPNQKSGEGETRSLGLLEPGKYGHGGGKAEVLNAQRRTVIKRTNRYRLRADLSPDEVTYVLEEFAKHSRIASATIAGDE